MMKYHVLMIVRFNDGSKDSVAVYNYDSKDEAIASFHKNLGSWMKNDSVEHILCMAIDDNGIIYKNECWDAPAPEPAPILDAEPIYDDEIVEE